MEVARAFQNWQVVVSHSVPFTLSLEAQVEQCSKLSQLSLDIRPQFPKVVGGSFRSPFHKLASSVNLVPDHPPPFALKVPRYALNPVEQLRIHSSIWFAIYYCIERLANFGELRPKKSGRLMQTDRADSRTPFVHASSVFSGPLETPPLDVSCGYGTGL